MNFLKIGSKKILSKRYGNRIQRRIQKLPMSGRKLVRKQLRNPGKNYGGKYGKIMGLRMDQNRERVGIKPKFSKPSKGGDVVRKFKGFKTFITRKVGGRIGSVLIGGGAVVATMLVMGKGSMESGANAMVDVGESAWELAETVGGSVEPLLKGITKIVGGTASGLNFLADNFLLICGLGVGGLFLGRKVLSLPP